MERWFTRRLCRLIMDPNSIQTAAAISGAKKGGPVYSDDLFHQRIYQQTGNESSGNYESELVLGDQGAKGGCLWFGRECHRSRRPRWRFRRKNLNAPVCPLRW